MRINIAIPEDHVRKPVLDGALEAVTRLNEDLIKRGKSPTSHALIQRGARWQPEPKGDEHFDHGATVAARGHGDCDDWAPLHAATLRVTGEDPGAKAIVRKSGPKRWHAIVQRSDGTIDDPSVDAGMLEWKAQHGVSGAILAPMFAPTNEVGAYIAKPQLALRPLMDRHGQVESWQARADLPWHWQPGESPADVAMVALHSSPVSDQAVVGALRGAWDLGMASGQAHPSHLARLAAIADACEGATWEDINERYGPEHAAAVSGIVGSFFGKAFKKLGKIAKGAVKFATKNPLGKLATGLIPGASLATAAFNAASPLLKGHVAKQAHLPPSQRQPMPVRVAVPRAAAASSPIRSVAPVIVHPKDPNVVLLTTFADRLQRAYEFGQRRPAPAPVRVVRVKPMPKPKPKPRRTPGTAWPR